MRFQVKARDPLGVTRTFPREAESRAELLARLRAEKLMVLEVAEEKTRQGLPPRWHPSWLRPMTDFDVEMGLRELASMLTSGITLLAALRTVAEQALSPRARRCWNEVADRVFNGAGFSATLAERRGRFSEITVRLSEVGERSGELAAAVTKAADQLEARRNLRNQVINAVAYPVVAVAMAVGVSVFLVVAVIPKVAEFLKSGGAQLPAVTQALMDVSEWVNANGLVTLVYAAAAVAAWFAVRANERGRELQDAFLLRLPVTGRILRLSGTALFARSTSIMVASGVTLLDSLSTASRLLANRRLRRRVAAAHDSVMKGVSLADSLAPATEFTPMLRRMAAVGERTGSLAEAFGESAAFHEMLLAVAVKRFGMLIEPVMIVITAGIVGFVYVAFFMALFSMAGTR